LEDLESYYQSIEASLKRSKLKNDILTYGLIGVSLYIVIDLTKEMVMGWF
jgi:hypothetical protein